MRCVNVFDSAIQKMLKPEINTMEFDFNKELENIHAGQVTNMIVYGNNLISWCMSNLIVKWDITTYEMVHRVRLKQAVNTMTLLKRKDQDLLVVGSRENLYYINPETLEKIERFDAKFSSFANQIIGLSKFDNEYFIVQDLYANLKIFETTSGEMIMEINGASLEIFTIVSKTLIELINPYDHMQAMSEEEHKNKLSNESSKDTELESEDNVLIATTVPIKGGWALVIYSINPGARTYEIVKVMNKKGTDISKGFSLLQLKGGVLAYSNYGQIEIIDIWNDFNVLKRSMNGIDPDTMSEIASDYVRKMVIIEKRRKTNALKEHPLGNYSLLAIGFRTELNLWNVDFKDKNIEMYKAEASRKLQHKKSVLDVAIIDENLVTCSVDSNIHLYDIKYKY